MFVSGIVIFHRGVGKNILFALLAPKDTDAIKMKKLRDITLPYGTPTFR
jgi:hypothetical protein